jgi:hypothetical protein
MTRGLKRQRASLQGLNQKNSEACIARIQALTVKEMTSKAHMQVHTNKGSREKQPGRKLGPNRAEMGLRQPAWADRPSPLRGRFGPNLCPRCSSIYCLRRRRLPHRANHPTNANHQKTAAARWGRELDELVTRINAGGEKEVRGGLQAAGLGVFPSSIAAIFIDDVLRCLHHPYVLQSV